MKNGLHKSRFTVNSGKQLTKILIKYLSLALIALVILVILFILIWAASAKFGWFGKDKMEIVSLEQCSSIFLSDNNVKKFIKIKDGNRSHVLQKGWDYTLQPWMKTNCSRGVGAVFLTSVDTAFYNGKLPIRMQLNLDFGMRQANYYKEHFEISKLQAYKHVGLTMYNQKNSPRPKIVFIGALPQTTSSGKPKEIAISCVPFEWNYTNPKFGSCNYAFKVLNSTWIIPSIPAQHIEDWATITTEIKKEFKEQ